jgi:hypothetical protein
MSILLIGLATVHFNTVDERRITMDERGRCWRQSQCQYRRRLAWLKIHELHELYVCWKKHVLEKIIHRVTLFFAKWMLHRCRNTETRAVSLSAWNSISF